MSGMFSDKAREYVSRRKTGTFLVCQNVGAHMEKRAKQLAPWTDRTAHARQSINGGAEMVGSNIVMHISHGVRYGRYLEQGTPPHTILPRHKKALYWAGAEHPVKRVNHPGTKKYPAIVPAAQEGQAELKKALKILWGA